MSGGTRRLLIGGVGVLAVLAAALVVALTRGHSGESAGTAAAARTEAATRAVNDRDAGVLAALATYARAVRTHSPDLLAEVIDPDDPAFLAAQRSLLHNLDQVPLAQWSYSLARPVPTPAGSAPVSVPVGLRYRLAGFDAHSAVLAQRVGAAEHSGRWYLTALTGNTGLWSYGPVSVLREHRVLVLGAAGQRATMSQVASDLSASLPKVTRVWGTDWAQRVVAQVPGTQAELAAITRDDGDLDQISALSTTEVEDSGGHAGPVGQRISINPRVWPTLSTLGRRLVLTHELTHIASAADTTSRSPTWLVEGFADYVAFLGLPQPVTVIAAEAKAALAAGHEPRALPSDSDFAGTVSDLPAVYERSWLACRLVAATAGAPGLVRLYRIVGTSHATEPQALAAGLRAVLHETTAEFTARWQAYLRTELG